MTTVYSDVMAATYTKIPGMLFWTSVVPPDPGRWKGTRIAAHGTIRQSNQHLGEAAAGEFLMDRAKLVYERIEGLSPRQRERIADAVRRNSERAVRSRSLEAWLDDERLRHENMAKRGQTS